LSCRYLCQHCQFIFIFHILTDDPPSFSPPEEDDQGSSSSADQLVHAGLVATDGVNGDPDVEAALEMMLAMGFNNEGGWLATLLAVKGRDIGKVVEIIRSPFKHQ
jgi:hypothetical protein